MITITVNVNHLRAMLLCAGKRDVRYYLNGIYLTIVNNRPEFVATDSYRMLVFRDREQYVEGELSVIMPRDTLEQVIKSIKKDRVVTIEIDGEIITIIDHGGMRITCNAVDGRYPDYRRVVPIDPTRSGITATVNPFYLADFGTVARLFGNTKEGYEIVCSYNGPSGAVIINFPICENLFGIVIPVRSEVSAGVPEWFLTRR